MHVQVVNFNLKDLTQEAYEEMCGELAPLISKLPGLVAKVWISDPETNTYGGIYLWESAQAMAAFAHSDVFRQVASNPHLANLTARDFGVLESPTRLTWRVHSTAA